MKNEPLSIDEQAEVYTRAAITQMEWEDWATAAKNLMLAAELHRDSGRFYDEARCLQMAATAFRTAGNTVISRQIADQAAAIPQCDPRLCLSILTEQAEGAFTDSDWERALPLFTDAIQLGNEIGLGADGMNSLLRRRGRIHLSNRELCEALNDYDRAFACASTGSQGFIRTEQAGGLIEEGYFSEAANLLENIGDQSDPHLRAEKLVLKAKIADLNGQFDSAIEFAGEARLSALEAVAPVPYFAASVELAEVLQAVGQHSQAYGALARAQATLSDLLGNDVAASWVEPCLLGFQIRWGEAKFHEARQTYQAHRRQILEAQ